MLEEVPCSSDISVVLSDDHTVRKLNRKYRNLDENTDVLAFSLHDMHESFLEDEQELDTGDIVEFVLPPNRNVGLGEVIISYPQATVQAKEAGHSTKRELSFLLTHGILHLLGYDHMTPDEETVMRAKQDVVLAQVLN